MQNSNAGNPRRGSGKLTPNDLRNAKALKAALSHVEAPPNIQGNFPSLNPTSALHETSNGDGFVKLTYVPAGQHPNIPWREVFVDANHNTFYVRSGGGIVGPREFGPAPLPSPVKFDRQYSAEELLEIEKIANAEEAP